MKRILPVQWTTGCLAAGLLLAGASAPVLAQAQAGAQPEAKAQPSSPGSDSGPAALEAQAAVDAEIERLLQVGAAQSLTPEQASNLFDRALLANGQLEPLFVQLEALDQAAKDSDPLRWRGLVRIEAQLHWRYGNLKQARERYQTLAQQADDIDARYNLARLWDAEGKTKEAAETYQELLDLVDPELAEALHIRIALMELQKAGADKDESDGAPGDPLSRFAGEPERSLDLRNRAAVVLALINKPKAAIALYRVEGGAKDQLLGYLRLAEWGIAAKDAQVAQEAAWQAASVATIARERRYALTLLAEAHRMDSTLPQLIERFHAEQQSLSPEARALWIDLLRETQEYQQAIELVQGASSEAGFTDEEQLELFEMYREAGRDQDLIDAYHERIAGEPGNVTWREGLARYFLESGDRQRAVEVWSDWITDQAAGQHLIGADALMALGLDELAIEVAEAAIASADQGLATSKKTNAESALLFLFDLYRERGRLDEARGVLQRLDQRSAPDAPVRVQLADAFERLGDQRRAVEVLTGLVASRPEGEAGEDVEMRLAWLQSEIGQEEVALVQWRSLWERVNSVPRRRYVEDRMMTVASRLGVLADVAVELEEKLYNGQATERDSGLLVRLYTKVGDAVSAAEVIEEFMRHSGGSEIQALTEKARVYLACTDYYHYEEAVKRLIELDPEGEPDYLRQLAMSQLERGKPKEAREVLMRLAGLESEDSSSAEFEAGVLSLSGMREEAVMAYRKGLAGHPDRIDAYILMAGLLKELNQTDQAVGMFQFLAETADKDDLFTIAIDGILNMLVDAPPRPKTVQWARRITLERLAARHDKPYLYQLLGDLASEAKDHDGNILALENALPSAGPRRGSMLRELMDLTIEKRSSFTGPGWPGDTDKHLAMGRRLVGLAEAVPPQVYLDLGAAFLKAKDERAAERTFALTRSLPDGTLYQRQAAASFEQAGFVKRALGMYEAVLATQPSDVPLLAKVGEVHENLGDDPRAQALYRIGLDLLLRRRPMSIDATDKEEDVPVWQRNLNVDDFTQNYDRVWLGLMATMADAKALEAFLAEQATQVAEDLPIVLDKLDQMRREARRKPGPKGPEPVRLERFPCLQRRLEVYRRSALAWGRADLADAMDLQVVQAFVDDDDLLEQLVRDRLQWGQVGSAKGLIESSGRDEEARRALLVRVGEVVETTGSSPIPLAEAARQVLPLIAEGRLAELESVVRRADLGKVEEEEMGMVSVLFSAARYLDNQDLVLKVGRDLLRLKMGGGRSYELEGVFNMVGGALTSENELALGRYFVSRVFEDPEKNAQLVTFLPTLAARFEEPLVSTEQVLQLLDGYGEKYAWGLEPVIALLPAADRASAVRSVWSKLEKTQRASLLLDLVSGIQGELGEDFTKFVLDNLGPALADAEEFLEYTIGELLDVQGKDQLVLQILDILQANGWDKLKFLPAIRAIRLQALDRHDEAIALAGEAWVALAQDDDWRSREALEKMGKVFLPADLAGLLAAHAAYRDANGDTPELRKSELDVLAACGPAQAEAYEAALDAGLEAYPENEALLMEAADHYRSRGQRAREARTLERLIGVLDDKSKQARMWRRVESAWNSLKQSEKVLSAKRAMLKLDGEDTEEEESFAVLSGGMVMLMPMAGAVEEESKSGLPKTMADLKTAVDEARLDDAALVLRRIWRRFAIGEPKENFRFFSYYSPLNNIQWPKDKDEAQTRKRMGGMQGFLEDLAERQSTKDDPETKEESSAFEHMAEYPTLVAELQRFLRTQGPDQLDRLQPLFKGLLAARNREMGSEASFADLVDKARSGRAGKVEKILLLASLDGLEGGLPADVQPILSDLPRTVSPRDAAQIRRLARVYARGGNLVAARAFFRWCGTQAQTRSYSFGSDDGSTSVTVRELVEEAKELFEGEQRIAMIEDVLQFAEPGDRPWERRDFQGLVLDTWEEVLPPDQALERSRSICAEAIDLGKGLNRDLASRATVLYAKAGELASALRALEIGFATLDPATITQPLVRWYREDPLTPSRMSDSDLERLFPSGDGDASAAEPTWLLAAAGALAEWKQADRIDPEDGVRALSWIAWLLHRCGQTDEAAALMASLGDDPNWSANTQLWRIDSLRLQGDGDQALALERALLQSGRLPVDRMPGVIREIRAAEGPAEALAAIEPVADDTRLPELLDVLVDVAGEAQDPSAVEHWTSVRAAAQASERKIEELEKKAKEKKAAGR